MELFVEDLISAVLDRARKSKVPEQVVKTVVQPTRQWILQHQQPSPPASTDLCYITDRILASSAPTNAPQPTYQDVGRTPKSKRSTTNLWSTRTSADVVVNTTTTRKKDDPPQEQDNSSSSIGAGLALHPVPERQVSSISVDETTDSTTTTAASSLEQQQPIQKQIQQDSSSSLVERGEQETMEASDRGRTSPMSGHSMTTTSDPIEASTTENPQEGGMDHNPQEAAAAPEESVVVTFLAQPPPPPPPFPPFLADRQHRQSESMLTSSSSSSTLLIQEAISIPLPSSPNSSHSRVTSTTTASPRNAAIVTDISASTSKEESTQEEQQQQQQQDKPETKENALDESQPSVVASMTQDVSVKGTTEQEDQKTPEPRLDRPQTTEEMDIETEKLPSSENDEDTTKSPRAEPNTSSPPSQSSNSELHSVGQPKPIEQKQNELIPLQKAPKSINETKNYDFEIKSKEELCTLQAIEQEIVSTANRETELSVEPKPAEWNVTVGQEAASLTMENADSTFLDRSASKDMKLEAGDGDNLSAVQASQQLKADVENAQVTPISEPAVKESDRGESSSASQAARGPQHSKVKNSPAAMATFLERRHGRHRFLAYSLSDYPPDDRTLLLFRRQIVQLGWWSPCKERSETPSIPKLLDVCYSIHAFLQLDKSNVVLVYCANGKTRTAIAIACYLKFAGLVHRTVEGFLHFLSKRGIEHPEDILKQLPPSLHLFFRQFDSVVELGGYVNRKPLLLRAIALQGIPVEDKPCLDIWDCNQRHVYSSHPEMWQQHSGADAPPLNHTKNSSQWADEEGFYRVNTVLEGDFLLLCRFGGDFAQETTIHDPSKILFRYANTTGFLSGGCPYELQPHKVDLMRRYAPHLDDDDFLVTLLFEAHWERSSDDLRNSDDAAGSTHLLSKDVVQRLATPSNICVWKSHQQEACNQGWNVIFQHHSARPNKSDVQDFQKFYKEKNMFLCSNHLVSLALQLSDFEYREAERLLLHSTLSWWQTDRERSVLASPKRGTKLSVVDEEKKEMEQKNFNGGYAMAKDEETSTKAILDILDSVNVKAGVELSERGNCWSNQALGESPTRRSLDLLERQDDRKTSKRRGSRASFDQNGSNAQSQPLQRRRDNSTWTHGQLGPDSGWMVPTIMYPQQGDIVNRFGPSYQQMLTFSSEMTPQTSQETSIHTLRPRLHLFSRDRPSNFPPPPSSKRQRQDGISDPNSASYTIPPYDSGLEATMELLLQTRHTAMTLSKLKHLSEESSQWGASSMESQEEGGETENRHDMSKADAEAIPDIETAESGDSTSRNKEAKLQQEKKWEDAKKAEAEQKEEEKKLKEQKRKEEEEAKRAEEEKKQAEESGNAGGDELPLKDDPEYAKYFKMLKMGMAKEQVLHAMKRDGKDSSVLDLDPTKSLKSQMPEDKPQGAEVPLKDDPEFQKYFKMLQMGLPVEAVKNALTRDGKDPAIMDLDPNRSLKSQTQQNGDGDEPALKDDPEYAKYFKMLQMGLPVGAVKNAIARDGKDPAIMDLDPNKSLKSQVEVGKGEADDGPPLKDDPEYQKYFKMLDMGLPIGAVKNALSRDGKDPAIMDLDPNKSVKSQMGGGETEADVGPPLKDDPEYAKYFKMLTMGLPMGAVKNALSRDCKDPAIMDLDPNKSLKSQLGGAEEEKDAGVPLKDDPEYAKYFKMMGMGLPPGAVKNALERDGKDPSILDLDPNKSVAFQIKSKGSATKKPVKKKKRVRRKKIYWTPIDPGRLKEDSMWSILRGSVAMDKLNYDVKEFEDLFTESADPADQKKKKPGAKEKDSKTKIQIIDAKRIMNGGIILAQLKTDYQRIADIVDKM